MAGAYCRYCGHRCFVLRELPNGRQIHMATCETGAMHDLVETGHTYQTARNPRREADRPHDFESEHGAAEGGVGPCAVCGQSRRTAVHA